MRMAFYLRSMPMLHQYPTALVRIECRKCVRKGRYRKGDLIVKYGASQNLADRLHSLRSESGRGNTRTGAGRIMWSWRTSGNRLIRSAPAITSPTLFFARMAGPTTGAPAQTPSTNPPSTAFACSANKTSNVTSRCQTVQLHLRARYVRVRNLSILSALATDEFLRNEPQ